MPTSATLSVFLLVGFAALIVPGPSVFYVLARGIAQGRKAAVVSAVGLQTGLMVHVVAAALGVSALVVSSPVTFALVKYVGAGYLLYLGLRMFLAEHRHDFGAEPETQGLLRTFSQGVVVSALNPKVALFFLAVLPQFVEPAHGPVVTQVLLLGGVLVAMGLCIDGSYALASSAIGAWLGRGQAIVRTQQIAAGLVFVGLGLATALTGHQG